MDDTISRQAVDKIINDLLENDNLQASPSVWHGLHMIKQLPSAQTELCGDVISREYLKEHIAACWINGRPRYAPELNELLSWIDDVPSAQPEPQWIPCGERLPELDQEVLVYAIGKVDGFGDSVIAMSKRHIFRLFSSSEGVEVWTSPWPFFNSNYEITHWMPLPEPYREENKNE